MELRCAGSIKLFIGLLTLGLTACGPDGEKDSDDATTNTADKENNGFTLVDTEPEENADSRSLVTQIEMQFSKALITDTVDGGFSVSSKGGAAAISIDYSPGENSVRLSFEQRLSPHTTYRVEIRDDLMSVDGEGFAGRQWQFRTAGNIGTTPQAVIDQCMSDFDLATLEAVNNTRAQERSCGNSHRPAVAALSWNCKIEEAALRHSQDMAHHDFFSHTGSNGSSVGDRLRDARYRWAFAAENLGAGFSAIPAAITGWLESPGHCRNLMLGSVSEFGSAKVEGQGTAYSSYWTHNFARPD